MLIKACLNGGRRPGSHPALPLTPQQLAEAASQAVAAGAGAVHIHPRDADGTQSLDAGHVGVAVAAVQEACPGVPVGVTTIASAEPNVARRLALVRAWWIKPDFASVNFSEAGAVELCLALIDMGVGVEAGLARPSDARALVESGLAGRCLRVLIEVGDQDSDAALATADGIIAILDAAQVQEPRLLHGYNATAWSVLEAALARGYDVRIGLEDTSQLPDGSLAPGNAELVAAAKTAAARAGRL